MQIFLRGLLHLFVIALGTAFFVVTYIPESQYNNDNETQEIRIDTTRLAKICGIDSHERV